MINVLPIIASMTILWLPLLLSPQSVFAEHQSGIKVREPVFSGQIYIEEAGKPENPDVLLVHGLGNNGAKDWQLLIPELSRNFHVVSFDLPGFGRSSKNNELYSIDNYTKLLHWIVRKYSTRPITIIGHSMGGAIALNYAARYGDDLSKLILVDAAGILHRTAFSKAYIDNFRPSWWWSFLPLRNSEKLTSVMGLNLEELDQFPMALDLVLSTPFTRQKILSGDPAKISGLALVQHDFSDKLENVTTPTLIIWGEQDNVAPIRTGKLLRHRLPDARMEIIKNTGHNPMLKKPAVFNNLVLRELQVKGRQAPHPSQAYPKRKKIVRCDKQSEMHITGAYEVIEIIDCRHVSLENVYAEHIYINNSGVEIFNGAFGPSEKAMEIVDSILFATAVDLSGEVPLTVDNSRLDLAGVNISYSDIPVEAFGKSTLLFSISQMNDRQHSDKLHGVYIVSEAKNSLSY